MIGLLLVVVVVGVWLSAGLSERSKANVRRAELEAARRGRDDERWHQRAIREEAALDKWLRSQP